MTDTTSTSDVAAALAEARPNISTVDVAAPASVVAVARRVDVAVDIIDLERHQDQPARHKGDIKALSADGFIDAVRRLDPDLDTAVAYADIDACRIVAILNDDDHLAPGWRDMRVTFEPTATPEWNHWIDGQGLAEQDRFARIIEEGELEIRNPSATVMLELAQTFHASSSAKFKQAGRLRDGRTQLVYEEEIEATAGEGLVAIPDLFTIEVRPFYGAESRTIECRLRYRLDRGDLKIGYTIHRPDEIRREAFHEDVMGRVDASGMSVLDAIAPSAR